MAFVGMVGKVLSRQLMRRQANVNAARIAKAGGSLEGKLQSVSSSMAGTGKYLFVAHPNCCERCKLLGMTPHFFNTPDVAFITHPNCLCATIEVPAGLSPAEIMEWAKNPVGVMRYGFNYGQALKSVTLTAQNSLDKQISWWNKMRDNNTRSRRKIRAQVTEAQKQRVRDLVASGELGAAKDLTNRIQGQIKRIETLKKKQAERIPVKTAGVPKKRRTKIKTLKNSGTTSWIPKPIVKVSEKPRKNRSNSAVIPQNYQGNTAVIPRNTKKGTGSFGGGRITASEEARRKMAEERKRKKRLEKLLKENGF